MYDDERSILFSIIFFTTIGMLISLGLSGINGYKKNNNFKKELIRRGICEEVISDYGRKTVIRRK